MSDFEYTLWLLRQSTSVLGAVPWLGVEIGLGGLGATLDLAFRLRADPMMKRNWSWSLASPLACAVGILALGVFFRHESTGHEFWSRALPSYLNIGLLGVAVIVSVVLVIRSEGVRAMTAFLVASQLVFAFGVWFVAAMSIGGDWI